MKRMALYEAVLAVIEKQRAESGDPTLGEDLERFIVDSQVREVERDILEDPGAIEPWLQRRRQNPR